MKRIMFYGDSNTWGFIPGAGTRYSEDVRWPCIVSKLLGSEYRIIEEGLNGRTTSFDDYYVEYRNGRKGLGYALCAHAPIDLIVVSLGINDLKYTDVLGSCNGLDELLRMIQNSTAIFPAAVCDIFPNGVKILVVSPIHLSPDISTQRPESSFADKYVESTKLAKHFQNVARSHNAFFLDASLYAKASFKDCVHMEPEAHKALGLAVAKKIQEIFCDSEK